MYNNPSIFIFGMLYLMSISFYNYFGLSVTKVSIICSQNLARYDENLVLISSFPILAKMRRELIIERIYLRWH